MANLFRALSQWISRVTRTLSSIVSSTIVDQEANPLGSPKWDIQRISKTAKPRECSLFMNSSTEFLPSFADYVQDIRRKNVLTLLGKRHCRDDSRSRRSWILTKLAMKQRKKKRWFTIPSGSCFVSHDLAPMGRSMAGYYRRLKGSKSMVRRRLSRERHDCRLSWQVPAVEADVSCTWLYSNRDWLSSQKYVTCL